MDVSLICDYTHRNSAQIFCCIGLNGSRGIRKAHYRLVGCTRLEESYPQICGYIRRDPELRVGNTGVPGNTGV